MGAPQYEQAGADIGGTGTTNTIPRWTGASTLGDSLLSQSGAFINAASNALVIDTGNVRTGVGAAPDRTFTVYAASGPILNIKTGTAGAMQGMLGISEVDAAVFFGAYSNHPLILRTNNTERARIDATGNVGIGTASPSSRVHALDSAAIVGTFQSTGNTTYLRFINSADSQGYIGYSQTALTFWSNAAERARIDSAGNLILNTATTGATIQAAGTSQGLKLPATPGNTDPNTLDCYADGGTANSGGVTWTPTLTFGGATTGVTYQTQVGRYTRVGNMVFATCYFVLTSKGTATGNVKITGLPTSSNTTSLFTGATVGYFANITSTGQVMGYMSPNDTGIILNQTTAVGANTALTDANFANNSAIIVTIAYPVT